MGQVPDFTITTACTPEYLHKLRWTLPTWPSKPQFKDHPLIIFTKGFEGNYKDFEFVKQYFSNWTFVDWDNGNVYKSNSEAMFSAFLYGAVEYVKTPYYVKLDGDAFFTNTKDVFCEEDFSYDCVGHSWGYTKPGWWVFELRKRFEGIQYQLENIGPNKDRFAHTRFASFICLHKVEFVKKALEKFGPRLPVPSHDTSLWYAADKWGKWLGKNMKRLGVDDSPRWKGIRERICSSQCNQNPMLDQMLMSHVQLELTTDCNLKCFNCDRNCGTAPSTECMSIEQVWKFIEESLDLRKEWERIDLIGGEPTLYPHLATAISLLRLYHDRFPKCQFRFSTNGIGKAQEVLQTLPKWVTIRNSKKSKKVQEFVAYNSAPCDNGERHIASCSVPWRCGLALTRNGYFLCGAGASVARVFGLDIGLHSLRDVTPAHVTQQIPALCKYCGHSIVKTRHLTTKPEISKSWQEAFDKYNLKKPKMQLY